jgi:hypothetical protein
LRLWLECGFICIVELILGLDSAAFCIGRLKKREKKLEMGLVIAQPSKKREKRVELSEHPSWGLVTVPHYIGFAQILQASLVDLATPFLWSFAFAELSASSPFSSLNPLPALSMFWHISYLL